MQITSGHAKGHQLNIPRVPDLRPTMNVVRQAIFNILGDIKGARILDIYAGSGSLGLEALSHGAQWVDFVDIDREACAAIRKNLSHPFFRGKAKIHQTSDSDFISSSPHRQYDLVFADPPYQLNITHILAQLPPLLKDNGAVVYLHHKSKLPDVCSGLEHQETRTYANTGVSFLTKSKT